MPRRSYTLELVSAVTLALIGVIVIATTAACSKNQQQRLNEAMDAEPSREDLIQAVRSSVAGKEYTESGVRTQSVPHEERVAHVCSQYEVDTDPNAKRNPELARCPRAGYTRWETKTVYTSEMTHVNETKHCESLPGPQSGWGVLKSGSDRWLVSYGGESWDVEKVRGNRVGAGQVLHVSRFTFEIRPRQKC